VELRVVELPAVRGESSSGELQVRHEYGFEGYVDLDGRRLVPPNAFDGEWYRTGDLASLGGDGTLTVFGRCDLSVNRDGVLLPLADVESRMRELEGVEEVAVVATDTATLRGRSLVAFCVLGRGAVESGAQLRSKYAMKAPAFAVPDVVRVMPSLPKLESGKIDRRALAELAREAEAH
jgi:acyl-coenzyme A synthetase/AMP-(fatty) acid ligase